MLHVVRLIKSLLADISVIGALGDSITCATGAMASNFMELSMENRGVAWSIGGRQQKNLIEVILIMACA